MQDLPSSLPAHVATALREVERKLLDTSGASLAVRIRDARQDLTGLFTLLHGMDTLQGRGYAMQLLVWADSELDRADATQSEPELAEAQLAWVSHDLKQATAWLDGANSAPLERTGHG